VSPDVREPRRSEPVACSFVGSHPRYRLLSLIGTISWIAPCEQVSGFLSSEKPASQHAGARKNSVQRVHSSSMLWRTRHRLPSMLTGICKGGGDFGVGPLHPY
jgi:hypothetical protein